MKSLKIQITYTLAVFMLLAISQLLATQAFAAGEDVVLSDPLTNNPTPGQPVDFQATIMNGPANCTVTGSADSDSFSVPAGNHTATVSITAPLEGTDSVTMSCSFPEANGGAGSTITDQVLVIPNPVVRLETQNGTTEINNETDGSVTVRIEWEADFADSCSLISWVESGSEDSGTYAYWRHRGEYRIDHTALETNGWSDFTLYETTELSITCSNSVEGAETTERFVMNVNPPADLPDPTIILVKPSENPFNQELANEFSGIVKAEIDWTTQNAEDCWDPKAYNLHEYPVLERDQIGWTSLDLRAGTSRVDLYISTSTVFTFTCGLADGSQTVDQVVTYMVTPNSGDVPPPVGDPLFYTGGFRTTNISVTPNPVDRDISGFGIVEANITASGADYCNYFAYETVDGITKGDAYNLSNWSLPNWWNRDYANPGSLSIDRTATLQISESTILESRCVFIADAWYGDTPEQIESGTFVTETYVEVIPPADSGVDPDVWVYSGPSVHRHVFGSDYSSEEYIDAGIWRDSRTVRNNIHVRSNGNPERPYWTNYMARPSIFMPDGVLAESPGSLTFTFDNVEEGTSRFYNIHVRHCDESDGAANWRILTSRDGEVGTYVSDKIPEGASTFQSCTAANTFPALMASNVELADGDTVTVECTPHQYDEGSGAAERCFFSDVYFGTGSGDEIEYVIPIDEPLENHVMWMSDGATRCDDHTREYESGFGTDWSDSTSRFGAVSRPVLQATTTYSVTCYRDVDGVSQTEETTVIVKRPAADAPAEPLVITDVVGYETGQCWEKIPLGSDTVDGTPDGWQWAAIAPAGHVRAESGLETSSGAVERADQCIPLVDLALENTQFIYGDSDPPDIDPADGVDNVNGRYSLTVRPFLQNTANYALPANSNLYYNLALDQSGTLIEETTTPIDYAGSLPANSTPGTESITDWTLPTQVSFGAYDLFVGINHTVVNPSHPAQYPEGTIQPDGTITGGYADNEDSFPLTLPPPEPPIVVTMPNGDSLIDNTAGVAPPPPLVRAGTSVELDWEVNVNYDVTCTVTGPGFSEVLTIAPGGTNPGGLSPAQGTLPEVVLQSTAQLLFSCTADAAPTEPPFEYIATIQVTPNDISEI